MLCCRVKLSGFGRMADGDVLESPKILGNGGCLTYCYSLVAGEKTLHQELKAAFCLKGGVPLIHQIFSLTSTARI